MIERRQVGESHCYRGRVVVARFMGPDLLGYVDDIELSGFYTTVDAVRRAGERYVDDEIAEKEKREAKAKR